jgi:hypothetical protein
MKIISAKQCNTCMVSYPPTTQYFHKHKQQKDGLFGICKSCRNSKKRNKRLVGKLDELGMTMSEYKTHIEKAKALSEINKKNRSKQYYIENRERCLLATKNHYQANIAQTKERKKQWYQKKKREMTSKFEVIKSYEFDHTTTFEAIEKLNTIEHKGGWSAIAHSLNQSGFRDQTGKPWFQTSINKFANKCYIKAKW